MTGAAAGAALGALGSVGVLVAVASSPPMRRPHLSDRLAPYLRDAPRRSRLLDQPRALTPFPTVERLLGPVLRDVARLVDRAVGGTTSVRRRLDRAGRAMSVEQFRVEQVIYGAGGLLAGLLCALVATWYAGPRSPVAYLVLCAALALAGVLGRDRLLSAQVTRRERRMLAEFPTVAELLALAVTAGEGAHAALERVARLSTGELSRELARALADVRAGASLAVALERMASRIELPMLTRFADGLAVAVERGTPLADVLRAQAIDAREHQRRLLLDVGGRKEIGMLVPVVFLVLPVTVVFALFPGFYSLSLSVP